MFIKGKPMSMIHSRYLTGTAAILVSIFMLLFIASCITKPDITGKWKEIGKEATLEFSEDGSFKAVDNQGMAVAGTYSFFEDGNLRCEIQHDGTWEEEVNLMVAIKGDELTMTSSGSSEVGIYKREK
jgi:hypothetical protein